MEGGSEKKEEIEDDSHISGVSSWVAAVLVVRVTEEKSGRKMYWQRKEHVGGVRGIGVQFEVCSICHIWETSRQRC